MFEFLGIPETKPIMESELEKALVHQIEKFLLELGRGFMFVGTQQRVTLNNTHYYVDMVFYNKPLRAYMLIELKTVKLLPEAVGSSICISIIMQQRSTILTTTRRLELFYVRIKTALVPNTH